MLIEIIVSLLILTTKSIAIDNGVDVTMYGGPYGYYCGIMHTSRLFDVPIDAVDRACQLHDTCISYAGKYLDCPCNQQLLLRMYETCPVGADAVYYRNQIINAMIVGTSMCTESHCDLVNRYFISSELGFNAIPFYGNNTVSIRSYDDMILYALVNNDIVRKFAESNLLGTAHEYLESFKKLEQKTAISINIPNDETLFVLNPHKHGVVVKVLYVY